MGHFRDAAGLGLRPALLLANADEVIGTGIERATECRAAPDPVHAEPYAELLVWFMTETAGGEPQEDRAATQSSESSQEDATLPSTAR